MSIWRAIGIGCLVTTLVNPLTASSAYANNEKRTVFLAPEKETIAGLTFAGFGVAILSGSCLVDRCRPSCVARATRVNEVLTWVTIIGALITLTGLAFIYVGESNAERAH